MVKSSTPSQSSRRHPAKQADKSKNITMTETPGKSRDRQIAELALGGVGNSATVAAGFAQGIYGELSLTDCVTLLAEKAADVHKGKLHDAETLLMSQAVALDAIFASLAQRAQHNLGEYLDAADRYMRLALKAQGQCRATLETLAAIKNPPVVIAKQANVANGPQQVNNTVTVEDTNFRIIPRVGAPARAENSNFVRNELLEARHEQRLDTGTAGAASGSDSPLAAVDAINRPAHRRG
jgi:hypothetical protein